MKNGVYQIRNLIDSKCYIGSCASVNGLTHRWRQHKSLLIQNKHYAIYLQNAWNKYSEDSFVFEIILYCDPENCLMYEQIALDCYQPAYNTCSIAGNCQGRKYSDETIERMKRNNTGANNPFYGKQHSQTTCDLIRQSKLGLHLGIKNPQVKLTEQDVRDIKDLLLQKVTRKQIASQFHISLTSISDIVTGKRWSHI